MKYEELYVNGRIGDTVRNHGRDIAEYVESGKKIEQRGQQEESVELRGEVEGTKLE